MRIICDMKKSILIIIALIINMMLLTSCGAFNFNEDMEENRLEEGQAAEEDKLIQVGFSQLGSESVWRVAHTESIKNALTEEKGFQLEFNNARQKQENQIKAIRSFIAEGVDYIVFAPVTEEGWDTVLLEAKNAGIPVIIVDRKISTNDPSLYATWIGSDSREEGEKAGKWLEQYLISINRKYSDIYIVVLQGTIGSSAQLGRTMGFDSIADKHKNWHILEQTAADFTTGKAKEVMQTFIKKYERINVVVSQNDDMTFGAIEAMEEKGIKTGGKGDTILISFDSTKQGLSLVQEGVVNVNVECNPNQGEYIADIIKKLDEGQIVEKEYLVDESVFTKENVDEFINDRMY